MSPSTTLTIAARFRGPARSGNGGYTAGALAAGLEPGTHRVTLRRPPPLEVPLQIQEDGVELRLLDGDHLVAQAALVDELVEPVEPVGYDEAVAAAATYPGLSFHPFPTCFACGVDRSDGLRIFPGAVTEATAGHTRVAAPWTPADDADQPTTWAALDCIGGWSGDLGERLMVLGQMTARVDALPVPGEPHVVVGQWLGSEGRRTMTASTLYDSDGRIVGRAAHIWVAVDPALFN